MSRRLVLASRSPRRRALLEEAGYSFEIVPSQVEEPPPARDERAEDYAMRLALLKAVDVAGRGAESDIVLGADTVVDLAGDIIGQPSDLDGARAMLRRLSGSRHAVVTGLALVQAGSDRSTVEADRTELAMTAVTDVQIEQYVMSGESAGKAGAYAIQETGDKYVRILHGSLSNVVGLPMELLARMLGRFAPELAPPHNSDENAACLDSTTD